MPRDDKYPCFKFYPDDFAGDGNVEAMTTTEVGAYILLLCKAWRETPCGSLPDDDRVLCRWARMTPKGWKDCRVTVLKPFERREDGRLYQRRMEREHQKLLRTTKVKQDAAQTRWASETPQNEDACGMHMHEPCMPSASETECYSDSSTGSGSSSSAKSESKPPTPTAAEVAIPAIIDSPGFRAAWEDYRQHRKLMKAKLSPRAEELALDKLAKFPEVAVAAIHASIESGWKGLFPESVSRPGRPAGQRKPTVAELNEASFEQVRNELQNRGQ